MAGISKDCQIRRLQFQAAPPGYRQKDRHRIVRGVLHGDDRRDGLVSIRGATVAALAPRKDYESQTRRRKRGTGLDSRHRSLNGLNRSQTNANANAVVSPDCGLHIPTSGFPRCICFYTTIFFRRPTRGLPAYHILWNHSILTLPTNSTSQYRGR